MATTDAADVLRTTAIVARPCPQCGHRETVSETVGALALTVTVCPACGCAEEKTMARAHRRAGHGVYVLDAGDGKTMAGVFPRSIPDEQVPSLKARFAILGPAVRYVSRWNDAQNRLEVLVGG